MNGGIGSKDCPLTSVEPMKLARGFVEHKGESLFVGGGEVWTWEDGRWVVRGREETVLEVMRWLEDAWVAKGEKLVRVGPTPFTGEQVVTCLEAVAKAPWNYTPTHLDGWDVRRTVLFEDVAVDVGGGKVDVSPRDKGYVDRMVLPFTWREACVGKCERWEQAVREWSDGDERWGELLRRWGGYLLCGHREYRKWMLMKGRTAGGKGTIAHVLRALMGKQSFMTVEMETLAGEFGLGGVPGARVLNISEVSTLEGRGGGREQVARFCKQVVGGDPISVNEKYQKVVKDTEHRVALMMSSNQVPVLPNEGQGLSAKMLVLPITRGFDQRGAEYGLKERLVREELPGIAAWFVEGARRLEEAVASGGEMWPRPARAEDVELQYRIMNNPVDAFLETHFRVDEKGFVAGRVVKRLWARWAKEVGAKRVPENQVLLMIEKEAGWVVYRDRLRTSGEEPGSRGLRGVGLLKEVREDL